MGYVVGYVHMAVVGYVHMVGLFHAHMAADERLLVCAQADTNKYLSYTVFSLNVGIKKYA